MKNGKMVGMVFLSMLFLILACIDSFSQPAEKDKDALMDLAGKGDTRSQALLAYRLKNGLGMEKDLEEARKWARRSADSRNGFAYWLLAQIEQQNGSPASFRQYLDSALVCEYPLAYSLLARLYETGAPELGIEMNGDKAFDLLRKAADTGDAEAAAYVGYQYLKERNEPAEAFKYIKLAAGMNDVESVSMLGGMYLHGIGTDPDPAEAYEWFRKAAGYGSNIGLQGLADFYRTGLVIPENQQEAFKLYSNITSFSLELQYILGYYYAKGIAPDDGHLMALSLLRDSAESGHVFAQAYLGLSQYEGTGIYQGAEDAEAAYPFLASAYANEDRDALPNNLKKKLFRYLSEYYRIGQCVEKDVLQARKLAETADALKDEDTPFAYIGMISAEECIGAYPLKNLCSANTILRQVKLDYLLPGEAPQPAKEDPVTSSAITDESEPRPVRTVAPEPYRTRFVLKGGISVLDLRQVSKTVTPLLSIGAYDLGGSRIGAEAGILLCPGVSMTGAEASMVLRAMKGIYPKTGIGFFSCKSPLDGSAVTRGLSIGMGVTFLLGKHLCAEAGIRYYPTVKVSGTETVSTAGVSYPFPSTTELLPGGIAPVIRLGWAF